MKTTMLEYFKIILRKVSFDRKLFRKEYKKSITRLSQHEAAELRQWLKREGMTLIPEPVKGKR